MNEQNNQKERLDVGFFSVESKPNYDLIRMLKTHPHRTAKEQVWEAVTAFYLPIAIRDSDRYSESQRREILLASIYSLLKQLHFLSSEMSECLGDTVGFPLNYQLPIQTVNSVIDGSHTEKKEEAFSDENLNFSNSGMVYEQQGLW
ncbi:hypothetical protein [Gloeothece verrucosa]|nr:hypothetical protein [Gloeothece verrucosa]